MSNAAITWSLKQRIRPSTMKFVLVAMADCANEKMESYPSVKYLENATCLDRKTIISHVGKLIDMQFIIDTGERKGRTKQIKIYRFNIDLMNSTENGTVKRSRFRAERVPNHSRKESQSRHPEPLYEPSLNLPLAREDYNLFQVKMLSAGMKEINLRRWFPRQDIKIGSDGAQLIDCESVFARDYIDQQFSTYLSDAFPKWRLEVTSKKVSKKVPA